MIKLVESAYDYGTKQMTLVATGTYDSKIRTPCTLEELEAFIVQLQKARLMMVVDQDALVEKKLEEALKEPDDKMRSILLDAAAKKEDEVPF